MYICPFVTFIYNFLFVRNEKHYFSNLYKHAYTLKAVMTDECSVDLKSDALSDIRYSSNI